MKFNNKIILKILESYKPIWALGYMHALAHWDLETYMPRASAGMRGEALAKIAGMIQQLSLDKYFVDLIESAQNEELNDYEKAVLRILRKDLKKYQKLPADFLEEYHRHMSESQMAWRRAREANDFSIFEPLLTHTVKMTQQKADYLGYQDHPYDALIDLYEEDMTMKQVQSFFSEIKPVLQELLAYIKKSMHYATSYQLQSEPYEQSTGELLNKTLLQQLTYDHERMRLDVSTHPFTEGFTTTDVRLTTRYESHDIGRTYTSTMHEFGHGLYSQQGDEEFNATPLFGGISLGLHESQSRFWENHVGRSQAFLEANLPMFHALGPNFASYSAPDYYRYLNIVKPSLIRVEADEVTYHFHIMIRFELELALITGELSVHDLPEAWNQKYRDYLGVASDTYSDGVLQDIHWSMGSIGYFPTYSIGTVLAAQVKHALEMSLGELSGLSRSRDGIVSVKNWLGEHMHVHGNTYKFNDMVQRMTGEEFSPKYWMEYLNKKYRELY